MNNLKMNVGGIKCDNKECNFNDMTVLFEDYDKWLNKPCPNCGCNLLTQQDYDTVKILMDITGIINDNTDAIDDEQLYKMSVAFNGTTKVVFSDIEPIEKVVYK